MLRVAIALIWSVWVTHADAGAWLQKRGETDAFVTSSFTYGDHGFNEDGELVEVPEYRKFELTGVIEYGVRPWITAIGKAEVREETREEITIDGFTEPVSSTFASVAGGARLRVYEAPDWILSSELTAFSGGFTSLGTSAQSDGPGVEARLLFGAGRQIFGGRNAFFELQTAYRKRVEDDDADEVRLDVTLGAQVLPKWRVLAQTFSTFEIGEEVHYHKVGASVVRRMTGKLHIEAGGLATVYGRNALQEFGGRVGFWYSF